MRVDPIDHNLTLNQPAAGYERSSGLHMSEVYNSLYAELEPEKYAKGDGPDAAKMELGSAFEEVLERALSTRILGDRPPEFFTQHAADCPLYRTPVKDGALLCACGAGIAYSPDHLIYNGSYRLGEFKCTWYSIRDGIEAKKFDKWFCQMRAYCYHLGTGHARLYVFFVNGDYSYKPPYGGAHIRAWDIEFTQRELDDNWALLVRHARRKGLLPA